MNKAHQTCMEMFIQRGYKILDHDDDKITGLKHDNTEICAFISNISKFNVERVQEYMTLMHQLSINHIIIILKETVTQMAKKIINTTNDMKIELFTEEELQYNITKHRLVPLHEKLSNEESIIFKRNHGTKFPIILKNDPISRFYAYEKGDIIKITRKNGYVTFRIVR